MSTCWRAALRWIWPKYRRGFTLRHVGREPSDGPRPVPQLHFQLTCSKCLSAAILFPRGASSRITRAAILSGPSWRSSPRSSSFIASRTATGRAGPRAARGEHSPNPFDFARVCGKHRVPVPTGCLLCHNIAVYERPALWARSGMS